MTLYLGAIRPKRRRMLSKARLEAAMIRVCSPDVRIPLFQLYIHARQCLINYQAAQSELNYEKKKPRGAINGAI